MSGRRNKQKRRNAGAQERRKPKTKHGKQEEKKIEWVSVEEYNSKGQMIMPRRAVQATEGTKYEPNKHTDLKLRICTGMAPQGVIIGQYKLYDIKTFGMGGWRMKADAIIEVGPTRGHEEDWFKAFKGSDVIIESPGLPGAISKQYQMKVSKSNFTKKVISSTNESGATTTEKRLFEGRLWMKETVKSTLLRRKDQSVRYVIVAVIGALIAALIGWLFSATAPVPDPTEHKDPFLSGSGRDQERTGRRE